MYSTDHGLIIAAVPVTYSPPVCRSQCKNYKWKAYIGIVLHCAESGASVRKSPELKADKFAAAGRQSAGVNGVKAESFLREKISQKLETMPILYIP